MSSPTKALDITAKDTILMEDTRAMAEDTGTDLLKYHTETTADTEVGISPGHGHSRILEYDEVMRFSQLRNSSRLGILGFFKLKVKTNRLEGAALT